MSDPRNANEQHQELIAKVAKAINDATKQAWGKTPNPMECIAEMRMIQAKAAIDAMNDYPKDQQCAAHEFGDENHEHRTDSSYLLCFGIP